MEEERVSATHPGRTRRTAAVLAAALALGLFARGDAGATDPSAGTSGAAFMKIGIGSARALGLGRAYVALAEGTDAMNWNPAGLGTAQQREFSTSYLRYIQNIGQNYPTYAAYAHPLGRTVLGANFGYLSVDGFEKRDDAGRLGNGADVRASYGFGTFSMARSFWYEKLFLGASLKAIHEDNDGTTHSTMVGDFGAMLKPNSYVTFGYASQNFGAGSDSVANVTRGGAAVRLLELLTVSAELANTSDGPTRLALGGEFMLPEDMLQFGQIYLRIGYHGTDDMGTVMEEDRHTLYPLVSSPKISFGLGLFTARAFGYGIAFDYALMSYGALGTADILTLKMKF
ncbi:MAG TPA: hypothetical protein DD417_00085 [Elusimicrobia bacterium]|nr:hypothetical protein [Elusimicrobiota bacterium]